MNGSKAGGPWAAILSRRSSTQKLKGRAADDTLTDKKGKELYAEEKAFRSKRKLVQEKRIKFAARIPAFMYLTDFREILFMGRE